MSDKLHAGTVHFLENKISIIFYLEWRVNTNFHIESKRTKYSLLRETLALWYE